MSKETATWLNQNTLIGFTDKRGHAWHYRAQLMGEEPNHYSGAVPIEDVRRRLFHWKPVEGDLTTTILLPDGVTTLKDSDRKTICRPPQVFGPDDQGGILGVFKNGYRIHDYEQWLLANIEFLLDDDLSIGSAGLLKGGAVAWVSVEVPENIVTPEGVEFRPNLLAATSLDGSLSTTYKRVVQNVVCDNTMAAGLSEEGQQIKIKHSRNSIGKLADAREALAIVHSAADDFAREVADLTATTVSEREWSKFLDALVPVPEKEGRGMTMATNKRDTLNFLWNHDERVAPWKGTAWGVLQAVNTGTHHEFNVRGDRAERNMLRAVTGGADKLDVETRNVLAGVLS